MTPEPDLKFAQEVAQIAKRPDVLMVTVDLERAVEEVGDDPAVIIEATDYVAMLEIHSDHYTTTVRAYWNEDDEGGYEFVTQTSLDPDGNIVSTERVSREQVQAKMAEELAEEIEELTGTEDVTGPAILDALAALGYELTLGSLGRDAFYAALAKPKE